MALHVAHCSEAVYGHGILGGDVDAKHGNSAVSARDCCHFQLEWTTVPAERGVFFVVCAAAGVVVGLVMNWFDSRYGNKLNAVTVKQLEVTEHLIKAGNEVEVVYDLEDEDDMYYSPLHPSEEGVFSW